MAAAGEAISRAAEVRAMGKLQAACEAALSVLPTSLAQDEALQQSPRASPCHELALRWRIGYKRCSP